MPVSEIPINMDTSPTVILDLIYRLKIKDVMSCTLVTAGKDDTLRSIQQLMKDNHLTGVPIVQGKRLIGLVSVDDIITALDGGYIEEPAGNHMSRSLIVLEEDMPISFAIRYFDRYQFHRYPVLNKQKELVGMLTSRDISRSLLLEINREVEEMEKRNGFHKELVDFNGEAYTYTLTKNDFENAGFASTEIKKHLKQAGVSPHIIRRAAIASYELEMNIVIHSNGGELIAEYSKDKLVITARDTGPGIPDIQKALTPGWSTANEWIRSLGFGAGMGLPNAKNCSDEFSIESSPAGTTVVCTIFLNPEHKGEIAS
ncbi:MAG: CBS domain-containing protein [Sphaerochaeta sp.]|jgi:CBS domain-containing protein|nr:CBS domain-containing protein [Sphaerochaeta sp.]MCH3920413.1 CBS domain-containing protein [Sphaerochaeta sp.]MCI2077023.1 CBS domain-containing protein [Sphaerochaeta sp.]